MFRILDPYDSKDACLVLGVWGGKLKNGTHLGNGVGTYNLSGGLLTAGGNQNRVELLGEGGTAIFTQSGGTNNAALPLRGWNANRWPSVWPRQRHRPRYRCLGDLHPQRWATDVKRHRSYRYAGTGVFTQSAGTNITPSIYLGGQAHKWPQPTGNLQTKFYTPGTYNLNGGLLQTPFITEDGHLPAAQSALASFNFSGGTLQADPTAGCYLAFPVHRQRRQQRVNL